MYKVTGSMQKSTEIMKLSNQLVRLPQVSAVMRQMSAEMTKVCYPPLTTPRLIRNCIRILPANARSY